VRQQQGVSARDGPRLPPTRRSPQPRLPFARAPPPPAPQGTPPARNQAARCVAAGLRALGVSDTALPPQPQPIPTTAAHRTSDQCTCTAGTHVRGAGPFSEWDHSGPCAAGAGRPWPATSPLATLMLNLGDDHRASTR
jgi:hypothetical protein